MISNRKMISLPVTSTSSLLFLLSVDISQCLGLLYISAVVLFVCLNLSVASFFFFFKKPFQVCLSRLLRPSPSCLFSRQSSSRSCPAHAQAACRQGTLMTLKINLFSQSGAFVCVTKTEKKTSKGIKGRHTEME